MKRIGISVLLLGTLALFFGTPAFGIIHYVAIGGNDQGNCLNPGSPCSSLAYTENRMQDGDTMSIGAGEWDEQLSVSQNGVVFIGAGTDSTIIDGTTYGIYAYARDSITVKNLRIDSSTSSGIRLEDGGEIYLDSVLIRDTGEHGIHALWSGSTVHGNKLKIINVANMGIYVDGGVNAAPDSVTLIHSDVDSCLRAVRMDDGGKLRIQNCRFRWNDCPNDGDAAVLMETWAAVEDKKAVADIDTVEFSYNGQCGFRVNEDVRGNDSVWIDYFKGYDNVGAYNGYAIALIRTKFMSLNHGETWQNHHGLYTSGCQPGSVQNWTSYKDGMGANLSSTGGDSVEYVCINVIVDSARDTTASIDCAWRFMDYAGTADWGDSKIINSCFYGDSNIVLQDIPGGQEPTIDTIYCDPQFTDLASSPPDLTIAAATACICGTGLGDTDMGKYDCPVARHIGVRLGKTRLGKVKLP